jgi:hypothetical protein
MMDLVEKIEGTRFLGREFLLWLWFECETFEKTVSVPGLGDVGLVFEKQLVLTLEPESCTVKAPEPMFEAEAHEALRHGKLPTVAKLRLLQGEREFAFRVMADSRGLSTVAIPNIVKEEVEQQFYDRMFSVEELETMIDALFGTFLSLRLSPAWANTVAPAMRSWIQGEPVAEAAYRSVRQKVSLLTAAAGKTPKGTKAK